MAIELNELDIVSRIGEKSKFIYYHRLCKITTNNKLRLIRVAQKEQTEWHNIRHENKEAFSVVAEFVRVNIVVQKRSFLLSYLKTLFLDEFKRLHEVDS